MSLKYTYLLLNFNVPVTVGEDISVALVKAIREGEDNYAIMLVGKYQELQADLGAMMQGVHG